MTEINVQPEEPKDPAQQPETEDELLAGKYKTEEDLQKGVLEALKKTQGEDNLETLYKKLEANIHSDNTDNDAKPEPEEDVEPKDPESQNTETEEAIEDSETSTDDLMDQFYKEYQENGELSEEGYEKLKAQGLSKHIVDNYFKGVDAELKATQEDLYSVTDGEENYKAMAEWAQDNLSEQEVDAYNEVLNGKNVGAIKFTIEALYNRFTKDVGNSPNLIQGSKNSSTSKNIYNSHQELLEDMGNPKYESDPAFRAKVSEKLERSDIF